MTDVTKYIETIKDRETIVKEVEELVGFLTYDLNPIGPPTEMMINASSKNSIETISEIRSKLDQIEKSIKNCEQ